MKKKNRNWNNGSLLGKKYKRLTILEIGKTDYKIDKKSIRILKCLCSCGNITEIKNYHWERIASCGCLKKEVDSKKFTESNKTHGMSKTKFYSIWLKMKQRCNKKYDSSFHNYGGRGITIDPRWNDFKDFKKDMWFKWIYYGKKYRKVLDDKNVLSIERKNVNGNYCKKTVFLSPNMNKVKIEEQ
jgi:hypothetical protein